LLPSPTEFDIFFPLTFVLHGMLGSMLAWMLNVRSVFQVYPIEVLTNPGETGACKRRYWGALFYRYAMGVLVCCGFTACALPYDFINPSSVLIWLGFSMAGVALIVVHIVFYFIWAFEKPVALDKVWRRVMCPYRSGRRGLEVVTKDDADLTGDVVVYMAIYFIGSWVFYCLMTILVPAFWAFWDVLILFGVYVLLFILARFTWLFIPGRKRMRMHGKRADGCEDVDRKQT
jgi:hypothetical protein